jgi:nicotinamide riboside transporter PnuC
MIITIKIILATYMVLNFFAGLMGLARSEKGETEKNIGYSLAIIISVLFFILVANKAFF